jgi:hypothetical protein
MKREIVHVRKKAVMEYLLYVLGRNKLYIKGTILIN